MINILKIKPKVEGIFVDSMGGKNPIYVVRLESQNLMFINSSNQETLHDFSEIFNIILEHVMDYNELEGDVYDSISGNEIYFEVLEKGQKGTLGIK